MYLDSDGRRVLTPEEQEQEQEFVFEQWFKEKKEICEIWGNGDDLCIDDEIKKFCYLAYKQGVTASQAITKKIYNENVCDITVGMSESLNDFINDFGIEDFDMTDPDIEEIIGEKLATEFQEFTKDLVEAIIRKNLVTRIHKISTNGNILTEYTIKVLKPTGA